MTRKSRWLEVAAGHVTSKVRKQRERERENERQYIELRISGALNPCILDTSIYSKLLANRCIDYSL